MVPIIATSAIMGTFLLTLIVGDFADMLISGVIGVHKIFTK